MRELLRRRLEHAGYIVIDTHDGGQVMELAVGLLPSVIILDVNLPHVSGWNVMAQLKADPTTEQIPVILYTASPDRQRAIQLGAAGFISKPATTDAVIDAVRACLPNRAAQILTDAETNLETVSSAEKEDS